MQIINNNIILVYFNLDIHGIAMYLHLVFKDNILTKKRILIRINAEIVQGAFWCFNF